MQHALFLPVRVWYWSLSNDANEYNILPANRTLHFVYYDSSSSRTIVHNLWTRQRCRIYYINIVHVSVSHIYFGDAIPNWLSKTKVCNCDKGERREGQLCKSRQKTNTSMVHRMCTNNLYFETVTHLWPTVQQSVVR